MTGLKQTMFLLRRGKTLGKDAHPPGTGPAQLNLPEKLNGCLCSLRPARALPRLLSAFFCLV